MEGETIDRGLALEVGVMRTLKSQGWTVKYHPSVRSGSVVYQPDILALKDGQIIGLEVKTGPASISDVAVIGNIRADGKLIVSSGAANDNVATQAERLGVKIVNLDDLVQQLGHVFDKRADRLSKIRSRLGFRLLKEHQAKEAKQLVE